MPAILNYLLHLATAVALVMGFFVVYTRVTPYDEVHLIREGNCAAALSLGGTLSGEHGIGVAKRDWMERAFDAPTLAAMRAIKAALDPDGILNPGKVLPPL